MARIGFLILPGYGHIPPSLALARTLRSRGHEILYYSTERSREPLEREHMRLSPLELTASARRGPPLGRYGRILDNFARMIDLTVTELPQRVRRDGMELLVIDQSVISGRTVAEIAGLPLVTFIPGLPLRRDRRHRLPPLFAPWSPASGPLARLRNRFAFALVDGVGLPFLHRINRWRRAHCLPVHRRLDDSFSDDACLTQLPEALEPDGIDGDRPFHLVGPLEDVTEAEARESSRSADFPLDRLAGRPVLYVSFGTAAKVPPGLYRTVLEGSAELGFLRVVSMGGRPVPDELRALEDAETIVVSFAPQLAILRRASLVVTHAGMNTTLESLLYGRPMLLMPICDDQPGVSARVAWAGAGVVLAARRASPERVRRALIRLRDDATFRRRAEALACRISSGGGVRRAADVAEAVLSKPPGA